MNFAMAFCDKDKPQVARWLAWVEELGGLGRHNLFLMPVKGLQADFQTNISFNVVEDAHGITTDWGEDVKSAVRDAAGPNSMHRQFCWFFHPMNRGGLSEPWMFIEPDCIPTRSGWANELESEYLGCGKPFMAAFVKGAEGLFPDHATGNMILPARAVEMSKLLTLPSYVRVEGSDRLVEYAFDVASAPDILPQCHFTRLLQHVFRGPTFNRLEDLLRLDSAACLFHSDKSGGLIHFLRRKRNGETAEVVTPVVPTPETPKLKPRVHTYFRPCVDPEALAEQQRILAIWEKNWREHGWEPVILTEEHARKHPNYRALKDLFEVMPTVSPKEYELAAWLRWIAMQVVGGGLTTDYDVLCNGTFGGGTIEGPFPLILSDNNPVPCAVMGSAQQFENAVRAFLTCPPGVEQGQPHLSDMLAVQKLGFPAKDVCREHGTPEWEKAAMIHFNHRRCGTKRSIRMQGFVDGTIDVKDVPGPEAKGPIVQPTVAECVSALVNGKGPDKRPIMEEIRERLVWIKDNSRGITRHHVHRELKALGLLPKK